MALVRLRDLDVDAALEAGVFDRVAVIGTSGAGKTTLARRLAGHLGHPHVELDLLYWSPGWVEAEPAEYAERVRARLAAPRWVTDGNYDQIRPLVWGRATALVWLDYPFLRILPRLMRRTLSRAWTRAEILNGNRESWRQSFLSRDSILWWAVTSHPRYLRRYPRLATVEFRHTPMVDLRSPAEGETLVRAVAARTPAAPRPQVWSTG